MAAQPQTKQRLSSKPPGLSTAETLDRLDKVKEWSEEPSKKAADAIGAVKSDAEVSQAVETPENVSQAPKTQKQVVYPWEGVDPKANSMTTMRLNTALYLKLKYLGETTFESNMRIIMEEALEPHIKKLLKEKGIKG